MPFRGRGLSWIVGFVTRVVAVVGVTAQAVLFAIELKWAAEERMPVIGVLQHQGSLLFGSVVLALTAFWISAQIGPSAPRAGLQPVPLRGHEPHWRRLQGRCPR
jgi:hypothetical protein